jgi:hypothetical protein
MAGVGGEDFAELGEGLVLLAEPQRLDAFGKQGIGVLGGKRPGSDRSGDDAEQGPSKDVGP